MLHSVGIELTALTINGVEVRCLIHSANQTCCKEDLQLNFVACTTSLFGLSGSFLDSIENDFVRSDRIGLARHDRLAEWDEH